MEEIEVMKFRKPPLKEVEAKRRLESYCRKEKKEKIDRTISILTLIAAIITAVGMIILNSCNPEPKLTPERLGRLNKHFNAFNGKTVDQYIDSLVKADSIYQQFIIDYNKFYNLTDTK